MTDATLIAAFHAFLWTPAGLRYLARRVRVGSRVILRERPA